MKQSPIWIKTPLAIKIALAAFILLLASMPWPFSGRPSPSFGDGEGSVVYALWQKAENFPAYDPKGKSANRSWQLISSTKLRLADDPPGRISLPFSKSHVDVLEFTKDRLLLRVEGANQEGCEIVANMLAGANIDDFHGDLVIGPNRPGSLRIMDESSRPFFLRPSHGSDIEKACKSTATERGTTALLDLRLPTRPRSD